MNTPFPAALPFRPGSLDDFNQYAKALARLLEEPLQRSQHLLARAYGYKDVYGLQVAMQSPGIPGPFEWDILDRMWTLTEMSIVEDVYARSTRLLELVAQLKDVGTVELLPLRYAKARDLKLFDAPPAHRAARKRIFGALDVLEGRPLKDPAGEGRSGISVYASLERTESGECFARLTNTGIAIQEALADILPRQEDFSKENIREQMQDDKQKVLSIMKSHPDCPWPLAEFVTRYARRLRQGGWLMPQGNSHGQFEVPEITAAFRQALVSDARQLLPDVTRAISLFEPLYRGVLRYTSSTFELEDNREWSDVSTWPELLYWGGRIAANAGERDYAVQLLRRVHGIKGYTVQHWATGPLAALTLDDGYEAVAACFRADPKRQEGVWEFMSFAASLAGTDTTRAAHYCVEAMLYSTTAIEAFNPEAEPLPEPDSNVLDASPSSVLEFMHLSAGFWEAHPEVAQFLRHIAQHPGVMAPVREWHRAMRVNNQSYGHRREPGLAQLREHALEAARAVAGKYSK